MRWLVVSLCIALAIAINQAGAVGEWGCCVPPLEACFAGGEYSTESSFQSACTAAGGTIIGSGVATTCTGFSECVIGCCCANADVENSAQINLQEDLLRITTHACEIKNGLGEGTYTYNALTQGTTCVEICSGTPGPGDGETYSVTGKIKNGTTPLEGAEVFIPIPGGEITDTSDAQGNYRLEEVPRINAYVFAIYPSCQPGQSQPLFVDSDKTGIDLTLDCDLEACEHDAPDVESMELVRGTDDVEIVMTLDDACGDFVRFEPRRCDDQYANCRTLVPTESPVIIDDGTGTQPQTTYCYNITARFGDGAVTSVQGGCVTTGDEACLDVPEGRTEWCGTIGDPPGPAVVACGEDNTLTAVETCEENEICTATGGDPHCAPAPDCESCNGLVGLFAKLGLSIPVGTLMRECGEETPLCYQDTSLLGKPLMVDAYTSCLATVACEDYTSEQACADDPCGMTECAWQPVNAELGKGICLGQTLPACDRCDDILGYCDKEACEAISPQCYFDGEQNGLAETMGCINADEMACRYYDTQDECNGGTDAVFAVQYDAQGARTGTTHLRTTPSADSLAIGACSWVADHERCIKDADMKRLGDEDDCIENDRYLDDPSCLQDSTPPTTTFYLADPPIYGRAAIRNLPYGVLDDISPTGLIETYVCFAEGEGTCYPTTTLDLVTIPEEGSYTLHYYSIDASSNLEEVRRVPIQVRDYGETFLEEIELRED